MILSYLERFSYGEIANLADDQSQAIDLMLDRGRRFIQEELFANLIGDDGLEMVASQAAASG
jgi:DNA-directed RNA polymerase specialized sigma24 family protein